MTNLRWDDVLIDAGLIRRLLRAQHPDLAELPIDRVPGGWDNQMWRIGDELAVRLPRSDSAVALLRREQTWLPRLAPALSTPAPVPERVGVPSQLFPHPWAIVRWVRGEPADRAPVRAGEEAALASVLRELHQSAPLEAPKDQRRGVPLSTMDEPFREQLAAVSDIVDGPRIRPVWDLAVAAPEFTGPPVWLHGDLHPANVVTVDGALAGIIDFGCLCAGDPAADLAAAWTILPHGSDTPFFAAYGNVDDGTIRRARGWAILTGLMLVAIGLAGDRGRAGGQPTWGPAGRKALRSCCDPAPQP